MESLFYDLRYALRRLLSSPGFTLTAILTLAFGIGATTAIFSIVEGVLLRPLPFPDQARLVTLGDILEGVKYGAGAPGVTAPGTRIYMRDTHAFSGLGGYQPSTYELSGQGAPAQINAARLTASVFPVLGVSPLMSRTFTQKEDETNQQLAILSYQTWRSRFHGDMHILGARLGLAGCAIGGAGAVFAAHLLRSMLFQVDPVDLTVIALSAISILLLVLAASVIPARRAASVEPMEALRSE
jgi:hypothetical protein